MPTVSVLPLQDRALHELLGDANSITIDRENSKLLEVARVLRVARGVKELIVTRAALLRLGEKDSVHGDVDGLSYEMDQMKLGQNFWDLEQSRPPVASSVEKLSFTATVQPRCFKQMEWLAGMLHGAARLKELKLNVFEYDSEALITEMRSGDGLTSFGLPSLVSVSFPGRHMTNTQRQNEEEGAAIGRMMVEAIMRNHSKQLRIEDKKQHPMEKMIEDIIKDTVPPQDEEEVAHSMALVAQSKSDALASKGLGVFGNQRAVLKCMTYEQYDDILQVLYVTQLPEGLERLTMRAILRGGRVRSQFLHLPCLEVLDLEHCEMDDVAFSIIGRTIGRRMPSLKRLTLRQNKLQDAELGLAIGPALEEIDLAQNPISSRAASHLFRSMEHNACLHKVDLSHTLIDNTVSFHGLNHWIASPAHLRMPYCLSDDELVRASQYMHENVELELVGEMSRELVCCGAQLMMQ